MSSHRTILSAFKLQKSLSHPYALMRTARIGVTNRYKFVSLSASTMIYANSIIIYRTTHARMSTSSAR